MSVLINVLVHIDNKVIGKYNYVNHFDCPGLLDSLWEEKKISRYINLKIFANICYPDDRDRIDPFEITHLYSTIIDNDYTAKMNKKYDWKAGYKVFITNLKPENVCKLVFIKDGKTTYSHVLVKNRKITYDQKTSLEKKYRLSKITNQNKEDVNYILDGTYVIINNPVHKEYYLHYINDNTEEINNPKSKKSPSGPNSICNLFNTFKGYKKVPNDEENKLL